MAFAFGAENNLMEKVEINKSELLTVLKKNRETHRNTFLEAIEGYREQAIAILEKGIADAKARKRVLSHTGLIEPQDMTPEYDQAIRMLEMCVTETVTISNREFQNYVMDNWSWKHQVTATHSNYLKNKSD